MGKLISTLVTVLVAVIGSAAIWMIANLVLNQARHRWNRFRALVGGLAGFTLGGILAGNRVIAGTQAGADAFRFEPFLRWVWLPLALGAVGVVWLGVVTQQERQVPRLLTSVALAAAVAIGLGLLVADGYRPALRTVPLIAWTVGGIVVGAGVGLLRRRSPVPGALLGGAPGSLLGGWGSAIIGTGPTIESIAAFLVPALFVGARLGWPDSPTLADRLRLDRRGRAVIFLGPALLFIFATLVVPTIRTVYLSLLNDRGDDYVGFENYRATFRNPATWDTSGWTDFTTSRLFWIGVIALGFAVAFGLRNRAATGRAVEVGNSTFLPLVFGALFVSFGVLSTLRGTIANNVWWVITVTFLSTAIGLAIAVLSDGRRGERSAKSLIFMPMAISLVGASVIWRFMYVARDTSAEQTGVMNAAWVALGKLSTGSGIPTYVVGVALAALLILAVVRFVRLLPTDNPSGTLFTGAAAVFLGWVTLRYWGVLGEGIGGFKQLERSDGATATIAQPINFIQETPFNNMWLMVVLIWMQTGFAMVILSSAIKAVPTEYLEAAKMDGASTSQIFWRITVPQIAPTIGVVVTTLIVNVMKVFDIIRVMTNGNFGTQVLANDMYQQAFTNRNTGQGAALAVILFVSVLPVMVFNIRRMQREA